MKRIFLFLVTNIAIMVVLSITLRILGVDSLLAQNGSSLNINALVIFSGVFGFGGAFISLAISKWMAKRMTGAVVINNQSCSDIAEARLVEDSTINMETYAEGSYIHISPKSNEYQLILISTGDSSCTLTESQMLWPEN